ncbi:MAG: HU family DNA-binding protein [Pseudomonadota bacterium]
MARATTKSKTTTTKPTTRKTTTKSRKTVSKTAAKPSSRPAVKDAPKVVPAPAAQNAPPSKVVSIAEPVVAQPELRKRELIDLVVDRSGQKKKDVKPAVEALLEVLGESIATGREFNLQPLGKLRINRVEEKGSGRVFMCRLRQSQTASSGKKESLAEPAE